MMQVPEEQREQSSQKPDGRCDRERDQRSRPMMQSCDHKMQSLKLQPLYGNSKTGKIKIWNIQVNERLSESIITTSHGYKDSKMITSINTIKSGKNIGKKNETTHFQQAVIDAKSKWTKKKNSGYKESAPIQECQVVFKLPMLAQDYKKHKNKIKYPCFIQPKLDGYRMIYDPDNKTCTSRSGKEYNSIYSTPLFEELKDVSVCLDGELYKHGVNFETFGLIRKKKLTPTDIKDLSTIEYHVYDIIDLNRPFIERMKILNSLENSLVNKVHIKIVPSRVCDNEDMLLEHHNDNIKDNYEGTIIRNARGLYIEKYRSYDLLKYKDFDDSEFKIVDYTSEIDTSGNENPLVVWICETSDGKKFNVQSTGPKDTRQELYKGASKFIGKFLWVKYFGLTGQGIPRFPKTYREGIDSIREQTL